MDAIPDMLYCSPVSGIYQLSRTHGCATSCASLGVRISTGATRTGREGFAAAEMKEWKNKERMYGLRESDASIEVSCSMRFAAPTRWLSACAIDVFHWGSPMVGEEDLVIRGLAPPL